MTFPRCIGAVYTQRMAARSIAVLAFVMVASCGDDGAPPAGTLDGSRRDGGGDAGPRPDGGEPGCTVEAPIELARDEAGGAVDVAVAGGPDSFLIAWTSAEGASAAVMPSAGSPGAPIELATAATDPAAVFAEDEWVAAWVDAGELHLRTVSADGAELGTVARLTDDAIDDRAPSLVAATGDLIAAWIRDGEAVAARTGRDGTVEWGPVALGAAGAASEVAVAPLGESDYFAAWSAPPDAHARTFGFAGTLRGEVVAFDPALVVAGGVAAAGGPLAGAVLFDVTTSGTREDVRLQPIAVDGTIAGTATLATIEGIWGRTPALVRFAGAWAGLWRAGTLGTGHVRLGLFALEGEPVLQVAVTPLSSLEGEVALAVATDGTVLAIWTDRASAGSATVVGASRMVCRR